MNAFRLRIDEIKEDAVVTSYTRWLESVQVRHGKSASLCHFQSAFLADLARIKETVAAACCQRTAQYWTTKSIFDKAVPLGQEVRIGRYEPHLFGGSAKIARTGVGKRCRRKYGSRSAFVALGEFSPKGAGHCDRGDHQEDGLEDRNRVAGAIKTSTGRGGDFFASGASGAEA